MPSRVLLSDFKHTLLIFHCQDIVLTAQPMEIDGKERCRVQSLGSGPRPGQKYMANRISDRVMYLEQRMNGFAAALEQTQAVSASESLSSPGHVRPMDHSLPCKGHKCRMHVLESCCSCCVVQQATRRSAGAQP